jgi:hypothetical protein
MEVVLFGGLEPADLDHQGRPPVQELQQPVVYGIDFLAQSFDRLYILQDDSTFWRE